MGEIGSHLENSWNGSAGRSRFRSYGEKRFPHRKVRVANSRTVQTGIYGGNWFPAKNNQVDASVVIERHAFPALSTYSPAFDFRVEASDMAHTAPIQRSLREWKGCLVKAQNSTCR